ncbi:hypothetical protein ACJ73_08922 [Blastomyces percursus]|uniref:Uncharacterized protein n=1 Tax=Blastomyces percursus TaxID=1658174 RepID=A0A1J9PJB4_9EURO|nr:hypothetical protein ACJ73_08922 [Blastomyces percursus]
MASPEEIITQIDGVTERICEVDLDDSAFSKLKDKIACLSARTAVYHSLERPAKHLRNTSPLPHGNGRFSKFLEALYGKQTKANSAHTLRWQKLRDLSCEPLLLIAIAYTPLDITKMGRVEFECLMNYIEPYLHARPLPEEWIFRREIQMAIAASSDLENISEFRQRYYTLEFDAKIRANNCHKKRRWDDSFSQDATPDNQTNDYNCGSEGQRDKEVQSPDANASNRQTWSHAPETGSQPSSRKADTQDMQIKSTTPVAEQQAHKSREIQYMFSKFPTELVSLLGDLLSSAMHASKQWAEERKAGESTTECLTVLIPEGEEEDISITLWAGRRQALRIIEIFRMQWTWSAPPSHVSPPLHGEQEL